MNATIKPDATTLPPDPVAIAITLKPMPSDVPVFARLRRACKALGRSFGLRVVECREMPAPPAAPVAPAPLVIDDDDAT